MYGWKALDEYAKISNQFLIGAIYMYINFWTSGGFALRVARNEKVWKNFSKSLSADLQAEVDFEMF